MADPEDILAGIVFTVTGLAIPSAVAAHHFFGIDVMAFANLGVSRHVFGWSFAAMAVAVAGLNVYLSFIAPWLYERRMGSMQGYRAMSGLPAIGGFFILFAGALIPASAIVGASLLVVYLADTGGLPWFLVSTVLLPPRD
ncbi:MAG: hypothetical protein HKN84_08380 [Gammaproteobacteria bacterium]|nr:hypothetical protein [Gammaproteobacteria bacterium]